MKEKRGYTLIEILVVLALFAIFLSMAVPNLELYKDMRENMELERLKKDLLFTRNSAILEQIQYRVSFDYDSNSYFIRNKKSNKKIKEVYLENGLKLNNKSGAVTFEFNRDGKVGKSNTIMLRNRKNERLEISLPPVVGSINVKKIN